MINYQNDHLGTPIQIVAQNSAIVWAAQHDSFGKTTVTTNTIENNLRFPGQYYDEETGTHYNYFRDYDPGTGRYIQSDPIGLEGGLNTYTYVENNPLSNIDPLGLIKWTGSVRTVSVVLGGGATQFKYKLESECDANNVKYRVTVIAGGPAVGFGTQITGSFSKANFEDGNNVADPLVFQGRALYAGISYAFIGIAYQYGAVQLGGARSLGGGHQVGIDASISGGAGISTVTAIRKIDCSCEE